MANAARCARYVLSGALALLVACNEGVVTFTGGTATVRLFNGQTRTGTLEVFIDSARVLSALAPAQLSEPAQVPAGTYVLFEAYSADSAHVRIASQRYVLADGQSYTIVVRGATITDFLRPIIDTLQSPFPDRAAVKVINATEETFVTLMVEDSTVGLPIVDAQSVVPFAPAPTGRVRVQLRNADTDQPIGSDTTVVLERGACYYVFVFDERSGTAVQQRWFIRKVY